MHLKLEEAEIVNGSFFFFFKEICLYKDCQSHILSFCLLSSLGQLGWDFFMAGLESGLLHWDVLLHSTGTARLGRNTAFAPSGVCLFSSCQYLIPS